MSAAAYFAGSTLLPVLGLDQLGFEITMDIKAPILMGPRVPLIAFLMFRRLIVEALVPALGVLAVAVIGLWLIFANSRGALRPLANFIFGIALSCLVLWFALGALILVSNTGAADVPTLTAYGQQLKGGLIPAEIETAYAGNMHVFIEGPISASGHRYISLNALPCVPVDARAAVERMAETVPFVFPIAAEGTNGNDVRGNDRGGNEFLLGQMPLLGHNPVASTGLEEHGFLLTAVRDGNGFHVLRGSAFHGIVSDSRSHLWLFQFGEGLAGWDNESEWRQALSYVLANDMWAKMAQNIALSLPPVSPGQPCDPRDYVLVAG